MRNITRSQPMYDEANVMEELGRTLRGARLTRGWTQEELAERADVSRPSVARLERGDDINTETLTKIAAALGRELTVRHRRVGSMSYTHHGTSQHRHARDLSRYLVHLTRSKDELISILKDGCIEARKPYGVGKYAKIATETHRSVCLTETPLSELERMTTQARDSRPWGVVFDKESLRRKHGAQSVWYLSDDSPELNAIHEAMEIASEDAEASIWKLTPFIERVSPRSSSSPNDWRWEREWRVQGDLFFEPHEAKLIVLDQGGTPEFLEDTNVLVPWAIPGERTATWPGGYTSWEDGVQGMIDRFKRQYRTPDEAGAFWDKEDGVYLYLHGEMIDLDEAMDDVFGEMVPDLFDTLYDELSSWSDLWCRDDGSWATEPDH